tara:strand:+ start:105499 stop:105660 length:162 start_codon:yes stop_codon:yes gene_type:complete
MQGRGEVGLCAYSHVNISPNPSSKRGIEQFFLRSKKNLNPTTVSLFEEGVREM